MTGSPDGEGRTTSTTAPRNVRLGASAAVRAAAASLERAGVPYCVRNPTPDLAPPPGADVDVLVSRTGRRAAGDALTASGWRLLRAPGHWGHQFWLYLTHDAQWVKIDLVWRLRYGTTSEPTQGWLMRRRLRDGVYVAADEDDRRHRVHRAAGRRERPALVERAARRLPPRPLRSGPVVAFLGPDGAGKGLVIAALSERVPVAVTTGYLGVGPGRPRSRPAPMPAVHTGPRPDAAAHAGPPPGGSRDEPTVPVVPQLRLREIAFLGRKWLRTLPTFFRAYRSAWRGHVVLLDRHPLDALAVRPRRSRWGARWERLLAVHLTPHPDAVVVLDAPGAVLFARKGEHSPGLLETWRQGYLDLERAGLDTDVHVVDATRPPEAVVAEVSRLVWRQLARRRGWADA